MMQLSDASGDPAFFTNQAAMFARASDAPSMAFLDPLDPDLTSDPQLTLSHRELGRLVFIAAETGARCEREGAEVDPVSWLFAPRVLFGGRQAVVACKERQAFVSAIILHGLSIGFDADPSEIDVLVAEGDRPESNGQVGSETSAPMPQMSTA